VAGVQTQQAYTAHSLTLLSPQSGGGSKTPLHFACCRGDPKAIIQALQDGVNVNAADDKACTPLHVAARYNHTEVCRFLMSQGADPYARDNAGRTPAQVTKSPETKAFFAEATQNPAVYMRVPGSEGDTGGPAMHAGDAPFVDAAADEMVSILNLSAPLFSFAQNAGLPRVSVANTRLRPLCAGSGAVGMCCGMQWVAFGINKTFHAGWPFAVRAERCFFMFQFAGSLLGKCCLRPSVVPHSSPLLTHSAGGKGKGCRKKAPG
jgi:hypothetical protein